MNKAFVGNVQLICEFQKLFRRVPKVFERKVRRVQVAICIVQRDPKTLAGSRSTDPHYGPGTWTTLRTGPRTTPTEPFYGPIILINAKSLLIS